jgi:hypothetical protein
VIPDLRSSAAVFISPGSVKRRFHSAPLRLRGVIQLVEWLAARHPMRAVRAAESAGWSI